MVAWFGLLHVLPRPNESIWIDGLYKKKEEVARAHSRFPKVVLVGGSSTHFSFSAETVSELTGLSVVNLGTHAGLGGEYLLKRAKASLRNGDTVVLILEHHLLAATKPSSVLASFVATTDTRYILSVDLKDVPTLLFGYSPMQLVRQLAAAALPRSSVLYRPDTVTDYGDESANRPENKLPAMVDAVRAQNPISLTLPDSPPRYLVEFTNWAKANNIQLLQAWPATLERAEYKSDIYSKYFARYQNIFNAIGFRTIGKQVDYLLPEADMLDTLYHADSVGQAAVSKRLSDDMCQVIECHPQRTAE